MAKFEIDMTKTVHELVNRFKQSDEWKEAQAAVETLQKARAILAPAIEAARERKNGSGLMSVYLNTSCNALLQAAELLESEG